MSPVQREFLARFRRANWEEEPPLPVQPEEDEEVAESIGKRRSRRSRNAPSAYVPSFVSKHRRRAPDPRPPVLLLLCQVFLIPEVSGCDRGACLEAPQMPVAASTAPWISALRVCRAWRALPACLTVCVECIVGCHLVLEDRT